MRDSLEVTGLSKRPLVLMVALALLLSACGQGGSSGAASNSGSSGTTTSSSNSSGSGSVSAAPAPATASLGPFSDTTGQWSSISLTTPLLSNPFFSALGANTRSCSSCHNPSDAWSATPATLQTLFTNTNGTAAIFNSVDGTNCGAAASSSLADLRSASSELLNKGLIRIQLSPPANAQYRVTSVNNPYGCNSTSTISVYRRILPATNLAFISTVMWDGRNSVGQTSLQAALLQQASDAIIQHEQATTPPPSATLQSIYAFEIALYSAQASDSSAGSLNGPSVTGGATALSQQAFVANSNDPFAVTTNPQGVPPDPVFTVFKAWEGLTTTDPVSLAEASIGRGEKLFNTLPMTITLVGGINDTTDTRNNTRTTVTGTCGTCHNTTNVGSSSTGSLFNTGVAAPGGRNTDLPVITLTNSTTGAIIQTTDPGLGLTTGIWTDVGKFKVPTLRNLAARPPYFHDGSAANLDAVVNFYNNRFNLNLTAQQHTDLVNFLSAL